ncbi:hypothetical protein Tco_0256001 [Tanacetum coccineum]
MENEHELSYKTLTRVYLGSYEHYKSVGAEVEHPEPGRITLRGQGVLRNKVRTGGCDVERLCSDLWCKVEDFGSVLWPSLAAADLGAQGKHVGGSCTQRKVSMVSFGRISPNSFLSSILLVVVIIVMVVIVVVILIVVVVTIVGVVIVVVIFGLFVVVDGWAYAFHQDKASLVRVPVANVSLSSSAHLLQENTDSFPLFATVIYLGPVFLLGLSAFAIAAACASRAADILVISCRIAS